MKFALIFAAVFLMAGASIPNVVYADEDDSYSSGESSQGTSVNPCAPETFDSSQCVTPQ